MAPSVVAAHLVLVVAVVVAVTASLNPEDGDFAISAYTRPVPAVNQQPLLHKPDAAAVEPHYGLPALGLLAFVVSLAVAAMRHLDDLNAVVSMSLVAAVAVVLFALVRLIMTMAPSPSRTDLKGAVLVLTALISFLLCAHVNTARLNAVRDRCAVAA